jgi:hypothetical protein
MPKYVGFVQRGERDNHRGNLRFSSTARARVVQVFNL